MLINKRMPVIIILAILTLSVIIPSFAYAAPLATTEKNWQFNNGNSWGWNYSPETQITNNNVQNLEVKWIFPLPAKSSSAIQSLSINEGSTTPPIVQDGTVFVTTNYLKTYAIDAETGKQTWVHDYVINPQDIEERLPVLLPNNAGALGILNAHLHGIKYWEKGNALLINGMACDFYGINATDGKTSFWLKDLCKDVPGNLYKYRQGTASQDGVGTYDSGNQFIFVLPGSMHSYIYNGDARHVMMGIDMGTKQVVWRIFSYPPQDKPTKDWALQECDIGFFQETPCSEVAAQAPQNLEWDWAQPDQTPSIYGGVTANWGGQLVVDENTGILYTQTGNQGPYTYIGATPGPRLYGSTVQAIDLNTGKRIWWLQPFPRDPYDYDCNWGGILADVQGLGKVYMKGCKEGRLYVMDASTGKPHYVVDVVNEQVDWGQITPAALKEPYQGGVRYHLNDPLSYYDMREMVSPDNSTYCGRPCDLYPYFLNGIFATDMSYDPDTQTLYHYASALQGKLVDSPPPKDGGSVSITTTYPITNTTIVARDVATGEVKWTWFYDVAQQRSHMVVTPTLLFTGFIDGYLRFFDKNDGKLLREMNLGSDLKVGITTGQDSTGEQMIFTIVGSGASAITPSMPGTVVGIGLSDKAAGGTPGEAQTTTVTTTSTTTAITTSATTVVSTAAPSTVTSTTTLPAQTVTQSVTETTGLQPEITYAAVAIAVIAVIAAGILATRRRP
jgi:outer membrane protein assembly factor BamB